MPVAVALDCQDRQIIGYVTLLATIKGADIRTLMDRCLWVRFGEESLPSNGCRTTDLSTQRRQPYSMPKT